jgi:hypothetical protein
MIPIGRNKKLAIPLSLSPSLSGLSKSLSTKKNKKRHFKEKEQNQMNSQIILISGFCFIQITNSKMKHFDVI